MKAIKSALLAVALLGVASTIQAQGGEQFIPVLSYRVGPYAAGGSGYYGGESGGYAGLAILIEPPGYHRAIAIQRQAMRFPCRNRHYTAQAGGHAGLTVGVGPPGHNCAVAL